MRRKQYLYATADKTHQIGGVAVVGSYQTLPDTLRPFKVRAQSSTAKLTRTVEVGLTREEAQRLVQDWVSFGLFGRHGRVLSTPDRQQTKGKP